CRAVRDSRLAAWYRCFYAPRTGGAYDSHHRTAGIAGRTRRRGGCVAARGARAADGSDASGRGLCAAAVGDTAEQTPEGIKLTSRVQHGVFWPRCIFWTTSEV